MTDSTTMPYPGNVAICEFVSSYFADVMSKDEKPLIYICRCLPSGNEHLVNNIETNPRNTSIACIMYFEDIIKKNPTLLTELTSLVNKNKLAETNQAIAQLEEELKLQPDSGTDDIDKTPTVTITTETIKAPESTPAADGISAKRTHRITIKKTTTRRGAVPYLSSRVQHQASTSGKTQQAESTSNKEKLLAKIANIQKQMQQCETIYGEVV
jgi:hypothetical protein